MRMLTPVSMVPPLANYSHIAAVPADATLFVFSGQLGMARDGAIPAEVGAQADLIFANLEAGLAACGLDFGHVIRLSTFVTDRACLAPYMEVRDRYVGTPPPASTLLIVAGFSRPEFKIEIEILAAGPTAR